MFHSAALKAVRIHLDPFIDVASQENPFSFCAQQFTDSKYRVCRCRARVIANKMQFQISSSSANSHIYPHSLHEDLAQGRFEGTICLSHVLPFPQSDGFGFAHCRLPEFVNYAHRRPGSVGMCCPCPCACLEPAFVRQMQCLTLGNFH